MVKNSIYDTHAVLALGYVDYTYDTLIFADSYSTYLRIADGLDRWPTTGEGGSTNSGGHFPDRFVYLQAISAMVKVVPY